ncbi:hypothetical protein ABENE_03770 [Asticcacaulis benevestitus DSM 16100 = ATCC BAA-896]|uniref:Uncharacterized protein n=1 Tax=Asticcacaulis benevestitus DSM 16100 = ATCC BAA-896 TaxID=1121022 RepID=V4PZK2_9CAUL|nr:hypothetical protein ABENE_03770 [Asticcacaulis benevestitus DSM 16100 = ATCC BAA-896]
MKLRQKEGTHSRATPAFWHADDGATSGCPHNWEQRRFPRRPYDALKSEPRTGDTPPDQR